MPILALLFSIIMALFWIIGLIAGPGTETGKKAFSFSVIMGVMNIVMNFVPLTAQLLVLGLPTVVAAVMAFAVPDVIPKMLNPKSSRLVYLVLPVVINSIGSYVISLRGFS